MNRSFLFQAAKYGLIGIINTLLTALVIWLILRFAFDIKNDRSASSMQMSIANFVGYFVGLINSFIFNRNWTFKSKTSWKIGFLKFLVAFGVCYVIQLSIVLLLNEYAVIPSLDFSLVGKRYIFISAYICQLAGIVIYTVLNFLCNKYYTFKN